MGTPIKSGKEFLVNTATSGNQSSPTITALVDGRFVIVWKDESLSSDDTSGAAIRAQMLNADGSKSGAEFLVNTTTIDNQFHPNVTSLADGRFAVAWSDYSNNNSDIRVQVFNADGTKSGTELLINTTTAGDQIAPALTVLPDGRIAAVWTDHSATGGDLLGTAIRAQIFNVDGTLSGTEFLVNSAISGNQLSAKLTVLADGNFVAVWTDYSFSAGDSGSAAVRAQVFDANGSKIGSEFLVNTTTFAEQFFPSLTALSDGRFVAAWTDSSQSSDDPHVYAVRAQVFNADGSKSGSEFLVNTTWNGFQFSPALTALTDGRFVASWSDYGASPGDPDTAVRAQVFNSDGTKSGSEFLVNTTTIGNQSESTLTALLDGRFVVSWSDASATNGDTSGSAIRAQFFDPRKAAINLEGSVYSDSMVGTAWNDTISGGLGEDKLDGAKGNDQIAGGYGDDTLLGGAGNDSLVGDAGNDSIVGGTGDDSLWGGYGGDTLQGGAGADQLVGGLGNDRYYVDSLNDQAIESFGEGNDTVISAALSLDLATFANVENARITGQSHLSLTGNNGANSLTGNAGANQVMGLGGNDTINSGAGNDTVWGGDGNDIIKGAAGNDTLFGGNGQDTLSGGVGKDLLTGDADADVFLFATATEAGKAAQRDVIVDFTSGQDKLDLSAIDADTLLSGDQAFNFIGNTAFSHTAGELRYSLSTGILAGDTNGDGAADFQLLLIGKPAFSTSDLLL